jgi:hypothetical protein
MAVGRREFGNVALVPIDAVEQRIERRAKIEASPAAIADFIDALRVFQELRGVDGIDQAQTIHVAPIRKQSAVSNPGHVRWFIWFILFLWFESDKPNRPNKRDRPHEL